MNDHFTQLAFSSAGWSEDQGSVELVVWGTKVVLLQQVHHFTQWTFSSAGWSEDQGSVKLVVWGTKVVLLQPDFFFSRME